MCHSILPAYEDTFFYTYLDTLVGIKNFRVDLKQSDPKLALQPMFVSGQPYEFFVEPNRIEVKAPTNHQDLELDLPCLGLHKKLTNSPVFRTVRAGMHVSPFEQHYRELPIEAFLAKFSSDRVVFFDGVDVSVSTLSLSVLDPDLFAVPFQNMVELHNDKVKVLLNSFGVGEE